MNAPFVAPPRAVASGDDPGTHWDITRRRREARRAGEARFEELSSYSFRSKRALLFETSKLLRGAMEAIMKPRCLLHVFAFLATVNPLLACELNGLTEAVDRLKGGNEPNARYGAEYCVKILQGDTESVAPLNLLLNATVAKDERLKEAIRNCPVEMYKRAC